MPGMSQTNQSYDDATLDSHEIDQFAAMADEWWDPHGKFKPLHKLSPARLTFIRNQLGERFDRDPRKLDCLSGLDLLDVGCGGGLLCEPLARLGARVTGIDPAAESIEAARRHAGSQGLEIDYQARRAEDLVKAGERFDCVLVMEVVEHVPDVGAFIATCARLVKSPGCMLLSTINRTLKSYALAIVGAEYILRWLPVGTHRWDRFVTVEELATAIRAAGLKPTQTAGLIYNPLTGEWGLGRDTDVNYLAAAVLDTEPAGQA